MRSDARLGALLLLGAWVSAGGRAQSPAPSVPVAVPKAGYSAAELYNSANAYARSGDYAPAVLNYERARVLAPRDADIGANFNHVRELAGVPADDGDWLDQHGRLADPDVMYWLGVAGLALSGGCFITLRVRPRLRVMCGAGVLCGLTLTAASIVNAAATYPLLSRSVAMHQITAGVSPVAGADTLLTVPAASTVRILARHGSYALIRDAQGREGWAAAQDLAAVIP